MNTSMIKLHKIHKATGFYKPLYSCVQTKVVSVHIRLSKFDWKAYPAP